MGACARTLCILLLLLRKSPLQFPVAGETTREITRSALSRLEPPSNLHPGNHYDRHSPASIKRCGLRMYARQAANYPAAFYADPAKRPPWLTPRPDQFRMDIITIARTARLTPHAVPPVAIKYLISRVSRLFFPSNNSRNYLCKCAIIT